MATVNLGRIKPVNKGTWSSATTYAVDDFVQYTDSGVLSTYIAVASGSNQAPSTSGTENSSYWKYMSKGTSLAVGNNKILVSDATGNIAGQSLGTAGQVLQVNSGANGTEFGTISSDMVKLTSYTISSNVTSFNITGWINSAYKFYLVRSYLRFTNAADYPTVRLINDSGNAQTNSYDWTSIHYYTSGTATTNTHGGHDISGWRPHSTNSLGQGYHGQAEMQFSHENLAAAEQTSVYFTGVGRESGGQIDGFSACGWQRASTSYSNSTQEYNLIEVVVAHLVQVLLTFME